MAGQREVINAGKNISERELEDLILETTRHGAVYVLLHFDAYGKDKEGVRASLVEFLTNLAKEKGALYCRGEVESVVEDGGVYSTFAEVKFLANNFETLHRVCLKYAPIGIQLVAPSKLGVTADEAQNILIDSALSTQNFSNYLYEKVFQGEERARFEEQARRRAEFGKHLVEEAEENEKKKSGGSAGQPPAP